MTTAIRIESKPEMFSDHRMIHRQRPAVAVMIRLVGLGHPPVIDDTEPLGATRIVIALVALFVFIACATPTPMGFPSLRELLGQ